jgi:hypothetical protein
MCLLREEDVDGLLLKGGVRGLVADLNDVELESVMNLWTINAALTLAPVPVREAKANSLVGVAAPSSLI